jgi:FemAB-related protein (PEP-CTERM system-associated)
MDTNRQPELKRVQVVDWRADGQAWDAYVSATPDGTVCHLYGWRQVIEHAYGHRTFYLAATINGVICGVLPLVLITSRLFGRHLVSMPFMDYGGVVTQEGTGVHNVLVAAAHQLAQAQRATLSLRCATEQGLDLPLWLEKLTMVLDLGKSEEALWKRLPSERRNRIRKGQKNGLSISFHGADALEAFYSIFAVNMRDLGSPVHSRGFFRHMFTHLSEYLRIILVHHQGRPIGAACCLFYKDVITIPGWISALRPFFSLCPNQVLHWELMRFGIANGYRLLDLGRSSKDTGTLEAKRQWHARPVQLYWYYSPEVPPAGGEQARFSRQADLWRRLPLSIANTLGPIIRQRLPN